MIDMEVRHPERRPPRPRILRRPHVARVRLEGRILKHDAKRFENRR
jgi:hypothetical protein